MLSKNTGKFFNVPLAGMGKKPQIQSTRTLVRNPKAMLLSAIKEQWHPDEYKLKQ